MCWWEEQIEKGILPYVHENTDSSTGNRKYKYAYILFLGGIRQTWRDERKKWKNGVMEDWKDIIIWPWKYSFIYWKYKG